MLRDHAFFFFFIKFLVHTPELLRNSTIYWDNPRRTEPTQNTDTIMILSFRTDMPGQTVHIRGAV